MKLYRVLLFCSIISSKTFGQISETKNDTTNVYSISVYDSTGVWNNAQKVSIDDLLKKPKKYHRKLVSVYCYVSLKLKGENRLYNSQESYKNRDIQKSILYAQFTEDTYVVMRKFKEGYAIITGIFSQAKDNDGKLEGLIYEVRRIDIPKMKLPSR